jgi:hypothetical protein
MPPTSTAHVNRISTTDLLFRTVKCLVEEIEANDSEYYKKELPEHIRERYSNRYSSFGMSKDKRAEKLAQDRGGWAVPEAAPE